MPVSDHTYLYQILSALILNDSGIFSTLSELNKKVGGDVVSGGSISESNLMLFLARKKSF